MGTRSAAEPVQRYLHGWTPDSQSAAPAWARVCDPRLRGYQHPWFPTEDHPAPTRLVPACHLTTSWRWLKLLEKLRSLVADQLELF